MNTFYIDYLHTLSRFRNIYQDMYISLIMCLMLTLGELT